MGISIAEVIFNLKREDTGLFSMGVLNFTNLPFQAGT